MCYTAIKTGKGIHMSKYRLRLFITGQTPRSSLALANVRRMCEEGLKDTYELEVIDVLQHPEKAEMERIIATPTLARVLPPPLRRVIGDLSDMEKVFIGLELISLDDPDKK